MNINWVRGEKVESIPDKTAFVVYGRFQPPTKGHKLLIDNLIEVATQYNAQPLVFVSPTTDMDRNPLTWEEKTMFLTKLIPGITIVDDKVSNPWKVIDYLVAQKYTNVCILSGSDQNKEYMRWVTYAQKHFSAVACLSVGDRMKMTGIESMSGTKARQSKNLKEFSHSVGWEQADTVKQMFNLIQSRKNSV